MDFLFDQDRQAWTTLAQVLPARRRRWSGSLSVSALLHLVVLAGLCWPALPIFIKPQLIAHGEGGNSTPTAVLLYVPDDLQVAIRNSPALLSLPSPERKKPQRTRIRKRSNKVDVEKPTGNLEAGSESGSGSDGPLDGVEVRPALLATYSEIPRSQLPGDVRGDVIVEITIDADGLVVEERLLQGVGHGVDERVIALLRERRYRPATRNGVPISSKQDVHFHFPS
jgi:protein TonB